MAFEEQRIKSKWVHGRPEGFSCKFGILSLLGIFYFQELVRS